MSSDDSHDIEAYLKSFREKEKKSRKRKMQRASSSHHPPKDAFSKSSGGKSACGENTINGSNTLISEVHEFLNKHEDKVFGQLSSFLDEIKQLLCGETKNAKPIARTLPLLPPTPNVTSSPASRFPSAPLNALHISPISCHAKRVPASAEICRTRKKTVETARKSKRSLTRRFDPNSPSSDHLATTEFDKWYNKTEKDFSGSIQLTIAINRTHIVDKHWFDPILNRNLLEAQHMDTLASLIAKSHDNDALRLETKDWSWMANDSWEALKAGEFAFVPRRVWPYVTGAEPKEGRNPWRTAKRVIGFALLMDKHWVCYEASFPHQRIMVYDSQKNLWSAVQREFSKVRRNLPIMCKMGRVWEAHKFTEPIRDEWDLVPYPKPPVVEDEADRAIIAIKVMQCLAYGVTPSEIITTNCDNFHKNLCSGIFSTSSGYVGRGG